MSNIFGNIEFREPAWMLLMFLPVLLLIIARATQHLVDEQYAERKLLKWAISHATRLRTGKTHRVILLLTFWLCMCIAIAGPRYPQATYNTSSQSNNHVLLLVDVSASMSVRDIIPDRIGRARLEITDFIEQSEGIAIGIIVFSAKAHLLSPPTTDKAVLRHYINVINTEMLPTSGSRLINTLAFVDNLLGTDTNTRHIIIVSDGGENLNNEDMTRLDTLLSKYRKRGIIIHTLGIGSSKGTTILDRQHGWLKHDNKTVITRLNEDVLNYIATNTNGSYVKAQDSNADWDVIYHTQILQTLLSDNDSRNSTLIVWAELFHWFVLGGIFTLSILVVNWQAIFRRSSATMLCLIIAFALNPKDSHAESTTLSDAYKLFKNEQYQKARQQFSQIPGYTARMGEASSAYRLEIYTEAAQLFNLAFLEADTDEQRGIALFNLANCYYQLEKYSLAESIYRDVINYLPELKQASINAEYAHELKENQQQQPATINSSRVSKGTNNADVPDGTDTTGASLTLGDDDTERNVSYSDTTNNNQLTILEDANTVESRIEKFDDTEWNYDIDQPAIINQSASRLFIDESLLWKRIFESEQGFPAPLDEVQQIPEVLPW